MCTMCKNLDCQSLAEYSSLQIALLPCSGSACFATMQQCLDSYFSEELVDSYVCSRCRSKTAASRKFRCIATAPEILMITLRWPVNALKKEPAAICGYKKIYLNVENPHLNGEVLFTANYALCGLIFHHGLRIGSGHYTYAGLGSGCAVLASCSGNLQGNRKCGSSGWRHWDDATVSQSLDFNTCMRTVLKTPSGALYHGEPILDSVKTTPYVFFYARMEDRQNGFAPSVPGCALCSHGNVWRSGLSDSAS